VAAYVGLTCDEPFAFVVPAAPDVDDPPNAQHEA
jgi:hypothetical protein